jgi:hypothetical protein
MFKRRASADVSQLGLDHGPQISRRVMPKFNYFAWLALKNNDHALSDLSCWNCHLSNICSFLM